MAEATWEYPGLHTASRSLIELLTFLYIALCIPKILKVFCIVYINKNPTGRDHSFHSLPSAYSEQKCS